MQSFACLTVNKASWVQGSPEVGLACETRYRAG